MLRLRRRPQQSIGCRAGRSGPFALRSSGESGDEQGRFFGLGTAERSRHTHRGGSSLRCLPHCCALSVQGEQLASHFVVDHLLSPAAEPGPRLTRQREEESKGEEGRPFSLAPSWPLVEFACPGPPCRTQRAGERACVRGSGSGGHPMTGPVSAPVSGSSAGGGGCFRLGRVFSLAARLRPNAAGWLIAPDQGRCECAAGKHASRLREEDSAWPDRSKGRERKETCS